MGTNWGCSDNTKWNLSIMGQQIKSLNVVEQNENSLPQMDIRRGTRLDRSDIKGTGGECFTRSEYPTVKMDQSYIPYTQMLDQQMAQDNGLFRSQQATQSQSFYHGRYQNAKTIVIRQRLDNQSGHGIRIPSRVGKRRTSTLSKFHLQRKILPLLSNVLWHYTRPLGILQDHETCNEAYKGLTTNTFGSVLRRPDLHLLESTRINIENKLDNRDTGEFRMEDQSRQIKTNTYITDRIPRLVPGYRKELIVNDGNKKERNDKNYQQMEMNDTKQENCLSSKLKQTESIMAIGTVE
ncbi:MAG: hypothetical protein EZS28_007626 [Streblomastix strix]|uniref:Uncharacterized protein n=1 Tax=Streblomastix strix TaxID=222440 RepID=A0A5J4WPD5_9EUKA|nr:MAG: hypothetical protein EZS28_007626 [Streblomastix strix]